MAEEMITVLKASGKLPPAAQVTRMCIPKSVYDENPEAYIVDEDEDAPCFDGLTKAEQAEVLARQKERAEAIEAREKAKK